MTFRKLVILAPVAYVVHIAEEAPRFGPWTRLYPDRFSKTLTTGDFVATNVVLMFVVLTAVALCLRRSLVVAGLSGASWEFSNAVFHIGLTVSSRIYSPGVVTAIVVYVPLSVATFYQASKERLLSPRRVALALFLGIVVANVPLRLIQYWL
jgi:hypothetical protein